MNVCMKSRHLVALRFIKLHSVMVSRQFLTALLYKLIRYLCACWFFIALAKCIKLVVLSLAFWYAV